MADGSQLGARKTVLPFNEYAKQECINSHIKHAQPPTQPPHLRPQQPPPALPSKVWGLRLALGCFVWGVGMGWWCGAGWGGFLDAQARRWDQTLF
jgi:hypothetical protein